LLSTVHKLHITVTNDLMNPFIYIYASLAGFFKGLKLTVGQ